MPGHDSIERIHWTQVSDFQAANIPELVLGSKTRTRFWNPLLGSTKNSSFSIVSLRWFRNLLLRFQNLNPELSFNYMRLHKIHEAAMLIRLESKPTSQGTRFTLRRGVGSVKSRELMNNLAKKGPYTENDDFIIRPMNLSRNPSKILSRSNKSKFKLEHLSNLGIHTVLTMGKL